MQKFFTRIVSRFLAILPWIVLVTRTIFLSLLLAPGLWLVAHPDRYWFDPRLTQHIPLAVGYDNFLLLVLLAFLPMALAGFLRYRGHFSLPLLLLFFYPVLGLCLIQAEGWMAGAPGMGHDALFPYLFPELVTIYRTTEELTQLGQLWLQQVVRGPVPQEWLELWLAEAVAEAGGSLDRFRASVEVLGELGDLVAQLLIQQELTTLARQRAFGYFVVWATFAMYAAPTTLIQIALFTTAVFPGYTLFEDVFTGGGEFPVRKLPPKIIPDHADPNDFPPWTRKYPASTYDPPTPPQPPPKPTLPRKWFFPRRWW